MSESEEEIRKCSGSTNISVSRETLQDVLRRPLSPSTPLRKTKKISDLSLQLESELSLNKKINAWNNNNILERPMAPLIVNPAVTGPGAGPGHGPSVVSEESYSDSNSSVAGTVLKNPAPPGVFRPPPPRPVPVKIGPTPAQKAPVVSGGAKAALKGLFHIGAKVGPKGPAPAAIGPKPGPAAIGPKPGPAAVGPKPGPAAVEPKPGPGPPPAAEAANTGPTTNANVANLKTPLTNRPTNPPTGKKVPVPPAKASSSGINPSTDLIPESSVSIVPGTEDSLAIGDGPGRKKKGKNSKSSKKGSSDTTAYPVEVDVTASYENDTSTSGSSSGKTSSGATKKHKDHKDNGEICMSKGMGAISFKVPGKITHKTTIKIAHYPQLGCEIGNKGCSGPYDCEELVIHENGAPGVPCNPCNPEPPCRPKPPCAPVPPCEPGCFPLPPGNYANNCNYYTLAENAKQQQQQQQQQQQYQMYQQQQQQQGMFNPYYYGNYGACYR